MEPVEPNAEGKLFQAGLTRELREVVTTLEAKSGHEETGNYFEMYLKRQCGTSVKRMGLGSHQGKKQNL
jgi:hypothetical protein